MPLTIFIVGLPSSGKSTVAALLSCKINSSLRFKSFLIDADHLGKFSVLPMPHDYSLSARNIRGLQLTNLVLWISHLDYIPVVAAIGQPPTLIDHWRVSIPGFFLVHLKADIEVCTSRDYKSTYTKDNVVGKDIPYVSPRTPDLEFDVSEKSAIDIVDLIYSRLSF